MPQFDLLLKLLSHSTALICSIEDFTGCIREFGPKPGLDPIIRIWELRTWTILPKPPQRLQFRPDTFEEPYTII